MTRTVATFAYEEPASTLIARFKYQGALQHGYVLADLLLQTLRSAYRVDEFPQLLAPVPLHPMRLRERGFNQALVLARQVGKDIDIPVAADLLARVRHTPAQQGLSARQRRRNLRGAFVLNPDVDIQQLRSIALIDDVVTTMSTLRELARMLRRENPALDIHVWCLARA